MHPCSLNVISDDSFAWKSMEKKSLCMVKHKSASRCLIDCVCIKGDGFRYCVIQVQSKEINYIQLFFLPSWASCPVELSRCARSIGLRQNNRPVIHLHLFSEIVLSDGHSLFIWWCCVYCSYSLGEIARSVLSRFISKQSLPFALLSINL